MIFKLIAGVAAALSVASVASAAEHVVNGDFTQLSTGVGQLTTNTVASGWDAANGGLKIWDGLAAGPGNFAAIDGAFQIQPLTQTITGLTVGKPTISASAMPSCSRPVSTATPFRT